MTDLKVIKVELPDFDEIEIIPIADTHIGDLHTDERLIDGVIKYVLAKDNRFVILNGDLMNMALKNSKSDVYEDKYTPSGQLKYVANVFKPIVHRILAIGAGNHEDRVRLETNVDITYWLAKEMGIEDKYADNSFVVFVRFGRSDNYRPSRPAKNVYSFFVWHGNGGGAKSGGKMNRVVDMQNSVIADVYVMAHVHDPMFKPGVIMQDDCNTMSVAERERAFVICNPWQLFGGYGQKKGYPPASRKMMSIFLNGRGKKMMKIVSGNNDF